VIGRGGVLERERGGSSQDLAKEGDKGERCRSLTRLPGGSMGEMHDLRAFEKKERQRNRKRDRVAASSKGARHRKRGRGNEPGSEPGRKTVRM